MKKIVSLFVLSFVLFGCVSTETSEVVQPVVVVNDPETLIEEVVLPAHSNWTVVENTNFNDEFFRAIVYGNEKFVIGSESGKIIYSTDGMNWDSVDISRLIPFITTIAYGDNKFIAGGRNGRMAYSNDGINWTAIGSPFGSSVVIMTIVYANGKFVAGGGDGKIAYSSNGINWNLVDISHLISSIWKITYGDNKFVAGGRGQRMVYSNDGINWTVTNTDIITERYIFELAYGNGRFVAVEWPRKIWYSDDGINWSEAPFHLYQLDTLIFFDGRFWAGNFDGKMEYSIDGEEWSEGYDIGFREFGGRTHAITYGNGRLFVVSWVGGKIAYSD